MKVFFTLFLLFSLSIFRVPAIACGGGGEPEEYRFFFPSSLLRDTSLVRYFSDWTTCDDCGQALRNALVEEWKKKYPLCDKEDIRLALFEYLTAEYLEQLKMGQNPIPKNTFFRYLINYKKEEVVLYLDFILDENKLMNGDERNEKYAEWEDQTKNIEEGGRLILLAHENAKLTKDVFLTQRYIFQIVKLLHYTAQYQEAVTFFDSTYKLPGVFPESLTYFRTLGYYAGAQRKLGNTVLAKYLFAKIFDQCPSLRYTAYKNFKYIDQKEGEWEKTFLLANGNSEKSAMLVAKNIDDFQIDIASLEELYQTDSNYTRLELALIKQLNTFHYGYYIPELKREVTIDTSKLVKEFSLLGEILQSSPSRPDHWWEWIWYSIARFFNSLFHKNEIEKEIWQDKMPKVEYTPFAYNAEWLPEWTRLLEKIIEEKKAPNLALYTLAKGYLEMACGEHEKGKSTLALLASSTDTTVAELSQYQILWAELLSQDKLSSDWENKCIAYLQKYGNTHELKEELARRYFVEKAYDKAYVLLETTIQGRQPSDYLSDEELSNLIQQGNKHLSKNFISHFGKLEVEKLKSTLAWRFFLRGQFEEASKIKNDRLLFDSEEATEVSYLDLAQWAKKAHLEEDRSIATTLATSISMPYNAVPCYNSYPLDYTRPSQYPFNIKGLAECVENRHHYQGKLNYSTDLAESYYRKVYNLLMTDEQKAEVLVNAQEVAMRDKYALQYDAREKNTIDKSNYYKELKEKYAHTDIVKELNHTCSFMRNEKIVYY